MDILEVYIETNISIFVQFEAKAWHCAPLYLGQQVYTFLKQIKLSHQSNNSKDACYATQNQQVYGSHKINTFEINHIRAVNLTQWTSLCRLVLLSIATLLQYPLLPNKLWCLSIFTANAHYLSDPPRIRTNFIKCYIIYSTLS